MARLAVEPVAPVFTEIHPLWGQMAAQGAGKRQVLFGTLRIGAIHESPPRNLTVLPALNVL